LTIAWLKTALRTRFEQLNYIAADNVRAAIRLDEEIDRQVDLLAEHPLMGREGRVKGTRELVIGRSPFMPSTVSEGKGLKSCASCMAPRGGHRFKLQKSNKLRGQK
jgi:toxin ParE1/3/4